MNTHFKNNIISALNYGGVDWENEGVNAIVERSIDSKEELIDMLRKHPNWNEERGAVVFKNYTEIREANFAEACGCIRCAISYFDYNNKYEKIIYNLTTKITSSEVTEEMLEYIKEHKESYGEFRIRKGQKITKVFRKMLDAGIKEDKKYRNDDSLFTYIEREYAKFADYTKPAELKRNLYLSINPADFLLMSNGNSWSSCHYFDGCHRGGTLSYALDRSSMILFTTEAKENIYDVLERKINRQVYCYQNAQLLQSRLYPSYNDLNKAKLYRNLVEEIICECTGMDNLWFVRSDVNKFNVDSYGDLHYPDWHYSDYNTRFCINKGFINDDLTSIKVGSDGACPVCGDAIEESESFHCYSHGNNRTECACCGEWYDSDDCEEFYINGEWVNVCWRCREDDRIIWCARCDSWHYEENMTVTVDGHMLCTSCIEYVSQCDHCEEYCRYESNLNLAYDANGNEIYVCNSCLNELDICPHCGNGYDGLKDGCCPSCGVVIEEAVVPQESAQVFIGA